MQQTRLFPVLKTAHTLFNSGRFPPRVKLASLIGEVHKLRASDVMLEKHPVGFHHCYIKETPFLTVSLFIIPKGHKIPLHDHPYMSVVGKVIKGALHIRAFDWDVHDSVQTKKGRAKLVLDEVATETSLPLILFPFERNLHEFTAVEDSALFDIIVPPYDENYRTCTFYSAKKLSENNEYWLEPRFPTEYNCENTNYVGPNWDI